MSIGAFTIPAHVALSDEGKVRPMRIAVQETTWYWSTVKVDAEEVDHSCSPDCDCWSKNKKRSNG